MKVLWALFPDKGSCVGSVQSTIKVRGSALGRVVLRALESSTWAVMAFMVCFWVIWNGWAGFFVWLTEWNTISNPKILYDFYNLYEQGKWWLSGAYISHGQVVSYPFAYPPSSLPFLGLFAQLQFGVAAQLWTGIGLGLFIASLLGAVAIVKPGRKSLLAGVGALLFFTSYALRVELVLGQVNLFLSGLTILSVVAHRSGHSRISAMLLAEATIVKIVPALFLVYFVVFYRDVRYLAYYGGALVATVGVSLLVVPIQLYWAWVVNVLPTLFVGTGSMINESVTGALSLYGFGNVTPLVVVGGLCVFALFTYRVHPSSVTGIPWSVSVDGMLLLNSVVVLLLGTRSWRQDYVWLILPTALLLSALLVENVTAPYFMVVSLAAFLTNFDTNPAFIYYLTQEVPVGYYVSYIQMIPTGLLGASLMGLCLILLFIRPRNALRLDPRLGVAAESELMVPSPTALRSSVYKPPITHGRHAYVGVGENVPRTDRSTTSAN